MSVNPDFRDLFRILSEEEVRYLVVGAYAVTFHSEPRYTKDLDIWVEPAVDNATRVFAALTKFGAPLEGVRAQDFTDEDMVYQIGVEPNRIDVLMDIAGIEFSAAWRNRVKSDYGGAPVSILSLDDLVRAKKTSGRPQDLLDVENLEKVLKKRNS